MEDSRITELFTLRDESAVTEAESKYGGYCHALAFNILGDPNDAEETVSDALFQLWQAIPPEKPKSLGAYFAKITRNIALNRIERSSAKKRGSGELPLVLDELDYCVPSSHSTEAAVDARMLSAVINRFLSSQKETARNIFKALLVYAPDKRNSCRNRLFRKQGKGNAYANAQRAERVSWQGGF